MKLIDKQFNEIDISDEGEYGKHIQVEPMILLKDVKEAVLSLKLLFDAHDMEEAEQMLDDVMGDFK